VAARFDRNRRSLRTTVAINRPGLKRTSTTGTSARKYIANDAVRDAMERATPPGRSNDDHVVTKSVALNNLGLIAQRAAGLANDSVAQVRAAIEQLTAAEPVDSRGVLPFASDKDVETFENDFSRSIVDSLKDISDKDKLRLTDVASRVTREKVQRFIPQKDQSALHRAQLPAPELDHVTVDLNKMRGTTDCFYSRIVFTLPVDKVVPVGGKRSVLRGVRVFRAEFPLRGGRKPGMLTIHGIERIKSNRMRSRSKNPDLVSHFENKLRENGVVNAIDSLSPFDSNLNIRVASEQPSDNFLSQVRSSAAIGLQGDPRGSEAISSLLGQDSGLVLDKSVYDDPAFLRNIQLRDRITPDIFDDAIDVGRSVFTDGKGIGAEHARQIQKDFGRSTTIVVDGNNGSSFKEITFVVPGIPGDDFKSSTRLIGDSIQYTIDDESINFGKTYQYYLVAVDVNMKESSRSRVVEVSVDGLRVPERPRNVIAHSDGTAVTLSIAVDDQLVEKFEVYRRDLDVQLPSDYSLNAKIISDKNGFVSNVSPRQRQANGYVNIGEALNVTHRGGSVFRDSTVKRGRKYSYRVYSVDIFGNKSESPVELEVFVVDNVKKNDLNSPTVLAEVDSATNKIKVTFFSDDDRLTGFFLSRRDVSIKQNAFVPPGEVNTLKFGNPRHAYGSKNGEDVVLRGKEHLWNGFFSRINKSHQVFVDQTVQFDRTYQYQIVGVDKFGNKTNPGFSRRVMVTRRPLVAAAVGLSAEIVVSSGSVLGVKLSWEDGNLDVSPEDRIGDRELLANTSVRTLYQIERQKIGEGIWKEFPMVEETEFFDVVEDFAPSLDEQSFRPEYPEKGLRYAYRIQAFQTGAFISNVTAPVEVIVDAPPATPVDLQLTNPDTKIRPFYVMLNWNTDPSSGVVDHWDIERSVVNNFAADRLNFKNPIETQGLQFKTFRTVYRESSRFNSQETDQSRFDNEDPNGIIVGEHHFMDSEVEFGQSYFYRIRAVSVDGTMSAWATKGIKISDPVFEQKQDSVLIREEKKRLSERNKPARFKSNLLKTDIELNDTSFSILPGFAKNSLSKNLNISTKPALKNPFVLEGDRDDELIVSEADDLIHTIRSPVVAKQIQAAVQKVVDSNSITAQKKIGRVLNTKVINLSKKIVAVPRKTTIRRK
jgi:hypothetical protein